MEVEDAANAAFSRRPSRDPGDQRRVRRDGRRSSASSGATQANACVFADRELDRSPTGSGTAGRIAQLHARGRFQPGETLVNESIIGSVFQGRVVQEPGWPGNRR